MSWNNQMSFGPSAEQLAAITATLQAQGEGYANPEEKRIADLKKQGLNPDGTPIRPEWESLLNPDGTIKDIYKQKDWQQTMPDTSAFELLKKEGLREAGTTSQATNLALQRQEQEQAMQADQAAKAGQAGMLQNLSNIAKSGGLSNYARNRALSTGNLQNVMARNQVQRQGVLDRMNLMQQDEQQRLSGLGNIQNMSNQQGDFLFRNRQQQGAIDERNLNSTLKEREDKRRWDMGIYSEQLKKWAAEKNAQAQAGASSGGGGKGGK